MSFIYSRKVTCGELQAQFREDVERLLDASASRWLITYGWRSLEQQAKLHMLYLAGGPLAAPAGKSPHNYGFAVDVVLDSDPTTPAIEVDYDVRKNAWMRLFSAINRHPRLKSGLSFNDGGHIERYRWQRHIAKQQEA